MCICLLPCASVGGAEIHPELDDYRRLVLQYRSGDVDGAAQAAADWTRPDLVKALGALWQLTESEKRARGWDVTNQSAAALLHLEVLVRHPGDSRVRALHYYALREHLSRLRRFHALSPRTADLHLALAMHLQAQLRLEDLRRLFEEVGEAFASQGALLLAEGTLHEVLASRRLDAARSASLVPGARTSLATAERLLRRADAATPVPGEARLRLAHVVISRGRPDEGVALLQPLLEDDTDAATRYLAYLFLGLAQTTAGRPELAERAFAASAAQLPCGRAAAIALAHSAFRDGRLDAAREALDVSLGQSGACTDPWTNYDYGQGAELVGMIRKLRSDLRT